MRHVWALGAMIVVAGVLGGCDSAPKSPGVAPVAAAPVPQVVPVATAPAPAAVAGAPSLPTETPEATADAAGPKAKVTGKVEPKAETTGAGKVVSTADAKRVAGHYYLTILAVKSEENAKRDAQFLASHGVSVSVEKSSNGYYRVMSVEGFAKLDAASKAFQQKVVAVGKEYPSAKASGKGAWDDAYFAKHGATAAKKVATTKPAV
jgi:hypothetical protein